MKLNQNHTKDVTTIKEKMDANQRKISLQTELPLLWFGLDLFLECANMSSN